MQSEFQSTMDGLDPSYWEKPLAQAIVEALCHDPKRTVLIDCAQDPRVWTASQVLALSYALAKRWNVWDELRVGVVLPPGLLGMVANLGLILAGKVPVNLNFTASASAIQFAMESAGIERIISTDVMVAQFQDFPWPEVIIDLKDLLEALPRVELGAIMGLMRFTPTEVLKRLWDLPLAKGDDEAILLFTSGSDGQPKGVSLTHRNLLANCDQIHASTVLPDGIRVLSALPLFHSFGFTVTMLYPVLKHATAVSVTSPLELKKIETVIKEHRVEVLVGTPTLFRPYLKRVSPEALRTVRYVVAGAEKTQKGLHEQWEAAFGSFYLEGYGLTETTPVVSVNLPDLPNQVRTRSGSVGKLFPGMRARAVHPQTLEPLALGAVGLVELQGPNVFGGYFQDPERTQRAFHDGWFVTGDLGYLDTDGFLYIEGRLSRFSKIAGEMVPHGVLESALMDLDVWSGAETSAYAITAIEDAARGESIVLLSVEAVELERVRKHLIQQGIPALWHPRHVLQVAVIPTLASGKLDLDGCRRAAQELLLNQLS
ncbi:MAG: hypothetical protein B7X06_02380 [Verrucomicrobia bacterium 21-51-4]|nr:MAG: hypothetical protein B7X06_02380 [Verrucomicrobia bacterium 21-51-4]HQU08868.1 AMP-binding protein [Opitutales bacterium]